MSRFISVVYNAVCTDRCNVLYQGVTIIMQNRFRGLVCSKNGDANPKRLVRTASFRDGSLVTARIISLDVPFKNFHNKRDLSPYLSNIHGKKEANHERSSFDK